MGQNHKFKNKTKNMHWKCLKIHLPIKCIIIHIFFKIASFTYCQKVIYIALMSKKRPKNSKKFGPGGVKSINCLIKYKISNGNV